MSNTTPEKIEQLTAEGKETMHNALRNSVEFVDGPRIERQRILDLLGGEELLNEVARTITTECGFTKNMGQNAAKAAIAVIVEKVRGA